MRYIRAYPYLTAFAPPLRTLTVCLPQASRATPLAAFPHPAARRRALRTTAAPSLAVAPPSPDMETVNTSARLAALRSLMKEHKVDIYGTENIYPSHRLPPASRARGAGPHMVSPRSDVGRMQKSSLRRTATPRNTSPPATAGASSSQDLAVPRVPQSSRSRGRPLLPTAGTSTRRPSSSTATGRC